MVIKRMVPEFMEEQKVVGRAIWNATEPGNYLAEEEVVVESNHIPFLAVPFIGERMGQVILMDQS